MSEPLSKRFIYEPDGRIGTWRILKGDGIVRGDCEDYALTMAWILSDRSMVRFWIDMFTLRHVIWISLSPGGQVHAVLWSRKAGWTDNITRRWVNKRDLRGMSYRLWFPVPAPFVAVMVFVSSLFGK